MEKEREGLSKSVAADSALEIKVRGETERSLPACLGVILSCFPAMVPHPLLSGDQRQ